MALKQKLEGSQYQDLDIIEWLTYGWPTGRLPSLGEPVKTFKNYKGAVEHPEALQAYISKEKNYGAVMGPYPKIPFQCKVEISPISTRPKKNTEERRIIVDLSFLEGGSLNDGMIKDDYMGQKVKLTFPRSDDLACRIYKLGKNAYMYKVDLSRYFRQIPLNPGDFSVVGYIINGELYFDKVLPMGMRTAPYIAQRVSNAIAHIHMHVGFFLLNYVDDLLRAEHKDRVWEAYLHLIKLLEELWVEISQEKLIPPTTRLEFLGITFDSQSMSMHVPQEKVKEIKEELHRWLFKTKVTRKELESLVGKLQFASKCIRTGKVFVARLIEWIKHMNRKDKYTVPLEARKDIAWWSRFMQQFNGKAIIWMHKEPSPDKVLATDACPTGLGEITGQEYFHAEIPQHLQGHNIAHLEMMAVLTALKLWGEQLRGTFFWVHVDNEAVATVLNSGASRDLFLQDALREVHTWQQNMSS